MFLHAEKEFKILERLGGNANIIKGVEYIPEFLRSRGYLVIEKVSGNHILNHVYDYGPFEEFKAKRIVKKIIEGVAYMH